MQARLLQRHEPFIGYRKGRRALAGVVKPVPVLQRPVLLEPIGRLRLGDSGQGRRQQIHENPLLRQHGADLVGEFGDGNEQDEAEGDEQGRKLEGASHHALAGRQHRLRYEPPVDASRELALVEQRAHVGHAEIAVLPLALAHDLQEDRPFELHQQGVVPARGAAGALEVVAHEDVDFRGVETRLGAAAVRILVIPAEARKPRELVLVDLAVDAEDARAGAALVEGAAT
ncbi:hypothetical protein ACVWW3_005659 [Bradyrhizobium sp. LM2.9]